MKLVISEKKELGLDIAGAMCGVTITENSRLPIEGNGYRVVSCAGHLLELEDPAEVDPKWGKPWCLDVLPIAPDPWPKVAMSDKVRLLNIIEQGLNECESVIHAGDPDDEGQLIVDEVLEHFNYQGKVERVYVNDNVEKNIRKAFAEMVINDMACKRAGLAALARQLGDATFGSSNSRLVTLKVKRFMTQGRVQTPTMVAVVNRDLACEGHVKSLYYEATAICSIGGVAYPFKFKPSKEALNGEKHLLTTDLLDALKDAIEGSSKAVSTSVSEKKTPPPLPYNLTDLLSDMNRRYKLKASKTQDISQALRQSTIKAITYNRTDSRYLKDAHFEEARARLECAFSNLSKSWDIDYTIKSEAFNDALAPNHHGIIPQESEFDISILSDDELKVYTAIVERFAMQFAPPEIYDESVSIIELEQGTLEYRTKRTTDPGFKAIFGTMPSSDATTPEKWLEQGEHEATISEVQIEPKETKPPKRYTEGSLLKDMASFAKYATDPEIKRILQTKDKGKKDEHGGIGTPATRTPIIEGLKKRGYLAEDGDYIVSTPLAREYVKILPEELKTPELTARWWIIQQEVAEGKLPVTAIQDDVVRVFEEIKDSAYEGIDLSGSLSSPATIVGTCPKCGMKVLGKEKSITCESNKYKKVDETFEQTEGCGFRLPRTIKGKKLTDNQVKVLLEKKKTPEISGFKSKENKPFSAHLILKPDLGIGFEFAKRPSSGKKKL